jgi:DNA polymerase-3 subunit chi
MGAAYFYHLTRSPVEQALPMLIERALAQGWRVAVRAAEAQRLEWLDAKLWLGPEEGFLPHGRAGGPHDADQPVLLTSAADCPNGAVCVMAIDGAEVTAAEAVELERLCVLFDGNDEAAVGRARAQWKALTEAGTPAQYWSEDSGRWQKKAER